MGKRKKPLLNGQIFWRKTIHRVSQVDFEMSFYFSGWSAAKGED
jgi:hypothetical protein|tara:strand:- start:5100 stop:5231 length:132 start_codon:yes stop_codon:yes gene_type:complete